MNGSKELLLLFFTNNKENIRTFGAFWIGAPLSSIVDIQTDYRFLVCANYLIFYRYENRIVFVSRVLYARRNYMRILFRDLTEDPIL